jgi:4-alpha-glucanotransferase
MEAFMKRRGCGILCHITSLPSPYGIGDFGAGAYAFADFLSESKQSYWQILPLNPTSQRYFYSPFSTMSSCAGNTIMISPELLLRDGLLTEAELYDHPAFPEEQVNYGDVERFKQHLFRKAHARFREREANDYDFQRFCRGNCSWLDEHAFFSAIFTHLNQAPLAEWPEDIRNRDEGALQRLREQLADDIEREKFLQYKFYDQWVDLRNYCNDKGIHIIGDFPLFINYDSVDIWAYPQFFKVDDQKRAYVVAGAPPDSFSADGQVFNCALYDWEALKKDDFAWWIKRFHYLLKMYDYVRIDHFRGLISYWEIPAEEQTGVNGKWLPSPTHEFFHALLRHFPKLPVIAEDLGSITAEVREAMAIYQVPGMKVLVLGFENVDFESVYLLHNHVPDSVAYTGTHDTNTVMGWFNEGSQEDKEVFYKYIGKEIGTEANWDFIRMAMMSVANTAIFQMQDVLGTGSESRMNYPGRADGNWLWRFRPDQYKEQIPRLAEMTMRYGRARQHL